MKELTTNEQKVYDWLKANPDWHSPTQIGKAVKGSIYESSWASRVCKGLVEKGLIEKSRGCFTGERLYWVRKGWYRAI